MTNSDISTRIDTEDAERKRKHCAEVGVIILLIVSVIAFALLFLRIANM